MRPGARHVRGLDALRFALALWVAISHSGFEDGPAPRLHALVRSAFNGTVNGAAAVLVFFVISGFCIHYPFRAARSIDLLPFYARRHIRILVPVAAAALLAWPLGVLPTLWDAVLWSLVCEEIYYTIYPALLGLRARLGWPVLLGASAAAAGLVLALAVPLQSCSLNAYPWQLNWIVGLPAWLLGAQLAEVVNLDAPAAPRARIWLWRGGALALGSAAIVLCFHGPLRVSFPVSLTLASPYAYGWLRAEIGRAETLGPSRIEALGVFSYSMYLVHLPLNVLFDRTISAPQALAAQPAAMYAVWLSRLLVVVGGSWLFYRLIEAPAHRLARRFQQTVLAWRAGGQAA